MKATIRKILFFIISFVLLTSCYYEKTHNHNNNNYQSGLHHWEIPSKDPDRIILTFNGDPSSSRAVTWRTDTTISKSYAEIAEASVDSTFTKNSETFVAKTEKFDLGLYKSNKSFNVNYHSVIFKNLKSDTKYLYRVGTDNYWSEWIQFKTANNYYSLTQFVYFGDAQNDILSHWSRVIRAAYQTAPKASFVIHAGDLVDKAHKDYEWAQWFKAGGFIHSQWTAIPVVGNHEFQSIGNSSPKRLSIQWRPQFNLPVEKDLDSKLHETVYTVNYQDVMILVLNSNDFLQMQTNYIKNKLSNSKAKWKIVTCHHSIFSPAKGRDFEYARKNWKPLFEKYGVDLVLNGHDHTYARGHVPIKSSKYNNKGGFNTLYVTSVSGPKQYKIDLKGLKKYLDDGYHNDKIGEQTQFFQVITIENEKLIYTAYDSLGEIFDEAIITKDFKTNNKTIQNFMEN